MIDRMSLCMSAALLLAGQFLYIVVRHDILIVLAWILSVAWMIRLVVVAWRVQGAEPRRQAA